MTLTVDPVRAEEVVVRLNEAFSRREGLLSAAEDLVENQIPEGVAPLSRDHALFLFYTVANDYGMKSSRLYAQAKSLFGVHREVFEPSLVLEYYERPDDPALIDMTGRFLGTRFPGETAKRWYMNSERLERLFSGDPRSLFGCNRDAQGLLEQIMGFRGYGPKIGGMLLRAIVGLGFAEVEGIQAVLLPVDIHDCRIAFFAGIVGEEDNEGGRATDYYSYARDIQRILLDACNAVNVPWPDVDRALWLTGSRGCSKRDCPRCAIQCLCQIGSCAGARVPPIPGEVH